MGNHPEPGHVPRILRYRAPRFRTFPGCTCAGATQQGFLLDQFRGPGAHKAEAGRLWLLSKQGMTMAKTVAEMLVERLVDWGVDTVFGLPGDGINGIFEALRTHQEKIRF